MMMLFGQINADAVARAGELLPAERGAALSELFELSRAANALLLRLAARVEDLGVSQARARCLTLLAFQAGHEGLRPARIAELLAVAAPTVTALVRELEREGLVRKGPDPEDRRARRVRITPAGEALVAQLMPALAEEDAWLRAALTEEEHAALLLGCRALFTALHPPSGGSDDR
ncbi:MAG: MarR family transcriptional regulator [Alphaproteobacteria bacterium]|nr:MarR family transcriptional regulator [Alphaproteobacteria bacterium]